MRQVPEGGLVNQDTSWQLIFGEISVAILRDAEFCFWLKLTSVSVDFPQRDPGDRLIDSLMVDAGLAIKDRLFCAFLGALLRECSFKGEFGGFVAELEDLQICVPIHVDGILFLPWGDEG